jgi:hypothetical protein
MEAYQAESSVRDHTVFVFDGASVDFRVWMERIELYLMANNLYMGGRVRIAIQTHCDIFLFFFRIFLLEEPLFFYFFSAAMRCLCRRRDIEFLLSIFFYLWSPRRLIYRSEKILPQAWCQLDEGWKVSLKLIFCLFLSSCFSLQSPRVNMFYFQQTLSVVVGFGEGYGTFHNQLTSRQGEVLESQVSHTVSKLLFMQSCSDTENFRAKLKFRAKFQQYATSIFICILSNQSYLWNNSCYLSIRTWLLTNCKCWEIVVKTLMYLISILRISILCQHWGGS